jgi:tripartite-type tricarboxylate transporter receptor subunit TctC
LEAVRVLRYILLLLLCVCTQIGQASAQANKGDAKKGEANKSDANKNDAKKNGDVYPSRPVRIVVPSPPGGGTDIVARVLAQHFSTTLKQQFFVENRPGAGNMIGIESVARSAPDGYTLLMVPSTLALNSVLYKKVNYDPIGDFSPITVAATAPNVLVINPNVPAKNVREFVAYAKSKPGELTYGTPGVGTSPHMSMELFKSMAGVDVRHIPYRGTAPAVTDIISGQIHAMFANALTARPQVEAGKVRALGVSGPKRISAMSDVPPVSDTVSGYDAMQWYGMVAPAKTPRAIIMRLHGAALLALKTEEMKEKLASDGAEPEGSTPEAFAALIKSELEKWAKVAREANIEAQ